MTGRAPLGALLIAAAPTLSWASQPAAGASEAPGWTAVQTHRDATGEAVGQSRLTYRDHRLRIDDGTRSVILELESGAMTYVDPDSRRWARVSLEELVKLRDEKLRELEARIEGLPERVRGPLREQLEEQRRAPAPQARLTPTDERKTVNGYACRVHRWKTEDAEGEACIASELPVDVSPFRSDLEGLGARMLRMGAGRSLGAADFLRLSADGFPVQTRQRLVLPDGRQVEAISEFADLEPAPDASMKPPEDYRQVGFRELMTAVAQRGAGSPPGGQPTKLPPRPDAP